MNGGRHGFGLFTVPDDYSSTKLRSYSGDWVDDVISGNGFMIYKNGDTYRGQLIQKLMHGEGKYTFNTNDLKESYDGHWSYDVKTGNGTMIWKDGDKYIGNWQDNKRHRQGKQDFKG